jgi:pimeloyl-ACP methyl ester carboxylesterase
VRDLLLLVPAATRVIVVRGEQSGHFGAADIAILDQYAAQKKILHLVLPNAGHWLHADNPDGLRAMMRMHLPER